MNLTEDGKILIHVFFKFIIIIMFIIIITTFIIIINIIISIVLVLIFPKMVNGKTDTCHLI